MKKEKETPAQNTIKKKTRSIQGIRLNNFSEIEPHQKEKFLLTKIDNVRKKQKKLADAQQYKAIQQPLNKAKERIKQSNFKIAPVTRSIRKPTRSAVPRVAATLPQRTRTSPTSKHVDVFRASANIFGTEAVPAEGIEESDGSLVSFDLAKENFTFDQLFNDFNCENLDLFVFDDVNIHLEEKKAGSATKNITSFNGNLRMDRPPLSALGNFLKAGQSIMVSGEIETSGQDLADKISPTSFTLTSAGTFMIKVTDDILLESAVLTIQLIKDNTKERKWTLEGSISGKLQISRFDNTPLQLDATVSYTDGTLHVIAEADFRRWAVYSSKSNAGECFS